jgi:hypothetical protein
VRFRFQGPLKKFRKWRTAKHPVPIRLLYQALQEEAVENSVKTQAEAGGLEEPVMVRSKPVEGGVMRVVTPAEIWAGGDADDAAAAQSGSKRANPSEEEEEEEEEEESVSEGGTESEDDGDSSGDGDDDLEQSEQDSKPKPPAAVRSSADIRQELIKLSMRGRDTGGEGVWATDQGEVLVSKETLGEIEKKEKKLRREEGKQLAQKRASQWDAMLDAGRQKKIKTVTDDIEKYKGENQFQNFQDTVAASGGFSTHFSQKWQADNARKQEDNKTRNADDWHEAFEDRPKGEDLDENDFFGSRGAGRGAGRGGERGGRHGGVFSRGGGRGGDRDRGGRGKFGDRGGGRGGRGGGGRGGPRHGGGGRGVGHGHGRGRGFVSRGGGRDGGFRGGGGGGRGRR